MNATTALYSFWRLKRAANKRLFDFEETQPLHKYVQKGYKINLTRYPHLHLAILGSHIYLSPWLSRDTLRSSPTTVPRGALVAFVESWLHLLTEPLDMEIAKDIRLIDTTTTWEQWVSQVEVIVNLREEFRCSNQRNTAYPITQRRLNWRYRLAYQCGIPFDGYKDLTGGLKGEWSFQFRLKSRHFRDRYQLPSDLQDPRGVPGAEATGSTVQHALSAHRKKGYKLKGRKQGFGLGKPDVPRSPQKETKEKVALSEQSVPRLQGSDGPSESDTAVLHAACANCKHSTKGDIIHVPQDRTEYAFERCDHHLMGFGRTSTQTSLRSAETFPIHPIESKPARTSTKNPMDSLPGDSLELLGENSPDNFITPILLTTDVSRHAEDSGAITTERQHIADTA